MKEYYPCNHTSNPDCRSVGAIRSNFPSVAQSISIIIPGTGAIIEKKLVDTNYPFSIYPMFPIRRIFL